MGGGFFFEGWDGELGVSGGGVYMWVGVGMGEGGVMQIFTISKKKVHSIEIGGFSVCMRPVKGESCYGTSTLSELSPSISLAHGGGWGSF